MKVLFVNIYDSPNVSGGGAETTLHHLTQGLIRKGVEPVILGTSPERGLFGTKRAGIQIWRAGIRNFYWPQPKIKPHPLRRAAWHLVDSYNLAMQPLLREVLRKERPDVVSLHNLPGWSAAVWKTLADHGTPAIQVLHDAYLVCPKATMRADRGNCAQRCKGCALARLPHRGLSSHVSAVVGVSRFILDRHLEHGYFHGVPVQQVIHNARDAAELGVQHGTRRDGSTKFRVGFIGRIDPSKGIEALLKAFSSSSIDAELWVAGSGHADYEQSLRSRWESNRVRFLGRTFPRDFYPQVDVVVVPSVWQEPLGMVVAEAFAFGKPVIASRRGGLPEMINEGEDGLLIDPEHPAELTAAIELLAMDDGLRLRMEEVALKSAQRFLDHDGWVNRYVELYARVARAESTRPGSPSHSGNAS